jgi:hypothetical protein
LRVFIVEGKGRPGRECLGAKGQDNRVSLWGKSEKWGWGIEDGTLKIQNSRWKREDRRGRIQNSKLKIQDGRLKIQDGRWKREEGAAQENAGWSA